MTGNRAFTDQPWADRALCAETDPESFFPDKGGSTRDPKAVCEQCPVRDECLQWALDTDQRFGIWGGLSERERRKLKKVAGDPIPLPDPVVVQHVDEQPATPPPSYGVYISATGHRPIPMEPNPLSRQVPKRTVPTGLDWSKHTAPEPVEPAAPVQLRCRWCREVATDLVDDVCRSCRDTAERQFHAPDIEMNQIHADVTPEPPTEGKQGKPTTGSSAPGATQASSTTGRAPVAGPSTHQEKNPEAAQETRPAAASGPTRADAIDELIDAIAHIRATTATELARIENALEEIRKSLLPASGFEVFQRRAVATEKRREAARQPRPSRRGSRTANVDLAKVTELLTAGHSCPQVARELGVGVKAVRTALDLAGIARPDGRSTHSGGKPRDYDQVLVDQVRALYVDQELSKQQVADRLNIGLKTVDTIMSRHGIPARKGQSGNADGAADLKARIAALGVTSRDIKTWAHTQGLVTDIKRGIAPTALVDAYENAHPRSTSDQSGAPAA